LKKRRNGKVSHVQVFGCDKEPVNGRLSHLEANLSKQDFFDYSQNNKYDTIIMNPPYIRHHLIDNEEREKYHKLIASSFNLKYTSDLWAYFLIKTIGHLNNTGSIGAILPWSFLQADYARKIRMWLLDKFEEIKILALNSEYFVGAEERVLLIWLKNYGKKTKSIKISFSRNLEEKTNYVELDKKSWLASPVVVSDRFDIESIIQRYISDYKFIRFGEIAKVQIGVVTGADKFFILPESEAKSKHFTDSQLIPILSSSKRFTGFRLNGKNPLKRLIVFSSEKRYYEDVYIKEGERLEFHRRAHSLLRTPWYDVNVGELPDAFFPYRMAKIPHLMLNNQSQSTNSIHRIYFKNLSGNEKKWAQVSLLSAPGQLSIESYSKTYGRGVLKIEPGALKKSIVYLSKDPGINSVYNQISGLISSDKKTEAMMKATEFLNEKLKIERTHSDSTSSVLLELQKRRLNQS
ncbi:MAG: N-6 DNA methylase, partial [bacterium]|nr:N-6 DNA methylase [bacterium]